MKKTHDYDNVFKTLKTKHKRLFISVINETFHRTYPPDTEVTVISAEGFLTDDETEKGDTDITERDTDFLIRLGNEVFLLECQSFEDGTIAIRLAEYAFITARKFATWKNGSATFPMPEFSVLYVKHTENTPKKTSITFTFPNGQEVIYEADNILLEEFTKEYIVEKRLFPYIPFYIARYEKALAEDGDISEALSDLEYFRDELQKLFTSGELEYHELLDLMGFVNTIITHITDGNAVEERLVKVMGGIVLETESEKLIHAGEIRGEARGEARGKSEGIAIGEEKGIRFLVETCQELNLSLTDTVEKLISKFGLTESTSIAKAKLYWKS